MEVFWIGNNNNEYGFKYGDKLKVTPSEENYYDEFCMDIYNYRTDKLTEEICLNLENIIDDFTCSMENLFRIDVPLKPDVKNGNTVCPNCGEIVRNDDNINFSACENCYQVLDWEEE